MYEERVRVMREYDLRSAASGAARPGLYVSGPMRGRPGDAGPWMNTRIGMLVGQQAWRKGWFPLVPMLNSLWEMSCGALEPLANDGANGWLDYDYAMLLRCKAIIRIPGESEGADREVQVAHEYGIRVIHPLLLESGDLYVPPPQDALAGSWEERMGR